ncbi:hypothetical protein Psi01_85710 [Planobispora siamensis]|uniref:Uncharacterized protein n=2 Tax=Planobispora siamensis TaxID=936338 RepID=A0A8J3SS83_9ACTN|nr:hypothetical protein Psi01_85710 [Planobispora siamensis]
MAERQGQLDIGLDVDKESSITLRYPRLAVMATTPASDARAIADGRAERTIKIGNPDLLDDLEITADVLATTYRQSTVAEVVTAGASHWIWLVVLAVLAFVLATAKDRLRSLLDKPSDRRRITAQPRLGAPGSRKRRRKRPKRRNN